MIVLIRHGESTSNAERLLVGRGEAPLTERGARQARALAPYLEGVVEVWSSPLGRARETAALAMPQLAAKVCEAFIEVDYGTLDGQPLSALDEADWRAFEHDHDAAFGGGESLAAVDRRVHRELDALLADHASLLHARDRHLAIVSHVSPIKSAAVWALGVAGSTAWRTRLDNGSITSIATRGPVPALVRFNLVPAPSAL